MLNVVEWCIRFWNEVIGYKMKKTLFSDFVSSRITVGLLGSMVRKMGHEELASLDIRPSDSSTL